MSFLVIESPIHREGNKLIIEPITKSTNIVALISVWRTEVPMAGDDRVPDIADAPLKPEEIL